MVLLPCRLLQEGARPSGLRVKEPWAIELLTGGGLFVTSTTFPCPVSRGCPGEDAHHSHEGAGSPGERRPQGARRACQPSLNSSSLQPNCCELQVASGSRSSGGGSGPNDLILTGVIHDWLRRSNLHVQVAPSPSSLTAAAWSLQRPLLLRRSCICCDAVRLTLGLILSNSTAPICSFYKVHLVCIEIP